MNRYRRAFMFASALALCCQPFISGAVDIRGRVDTQGYRGYFPLPNAEIAIFYQGSFIYGTLTDGYGFYYFRGLQPGPHDIVINGRLRLPLFINNVPAQDIPPILCC